MAGALIGVAVLALAAWRIATLAGGQTMERLAVLPLVDLTNDPDQEFLAAGVHEALSKELGRLGLSVTSLRTTNQYRDSEKGIAEIAEELEVDGVIEGSVFRAGDSLEIATRLYDRDEQQVWAGSFDGVLPNVVALYRGFARAIAEQIRMSLSEADNAYLSQASPLNPDVYQAYLRGMHMLNNTTTDRLLGKPGDPAVGYERAIGYLNQAVEQNPADPLAYAGLALAWATIGHGPDPPVDAWPRARAAALRAIRLDSTLAEGWAALADYKSYAEHDWAGAEQAFRRANELNPSLAMNHYHYAWYLTLFGRVDEALVEHRRAAELDPLTPLHTLWIPAIFQFSRDYDRAVREARLLTEQYPNHTLIWRVLAHSAVGAGLHDEAVEAIERAVELAPNRWRLDRAEVYAYVGRTDDALRILQEVEALPPMPGLALGLAKVHVALGNREEALRWLEYEPPHAWVAWNLSSERMEPYRTDPRFQALARRFNLALEPGAWRPTPLPVVAPPLSGTTDAESGG